MRIITAKRAREFAEQHPDARERLERWMDTTARARWRSIQDVRALYPHADGVAVGSGNLVTVFNVRGNRYRLITAIHYNAGKVFLLRFLTHAEYDKEQWKDQL